MKHIREAFTFGRFSCIPAIHSLVNVLLKMLITHIVIAPNNHSPEMTPETFNAVGENVTVGIFLCTMTDNGMVITKFLYSVIGIKLISDYH